MTRQRWIGTSRRLAAIVAWMLGSTAVVWSMRTSPRSAVASGPRRRPPGADCTAPAAAAPAGHRPAPAAVRRPATPAATPACSVTTTGGHAQAHRARSGARIRVHRPPARLRKLPRSRAGPRGRRRQGEHQAVRSAHARRGERDLSVVPQPRYARGLGRAARTRRGT